MHDAPAGRLLPSRPRARAEFWTWFSWVVNSYGHDLGLCGGAFHRDPRYRLFTPPDFGVATYDHFTEASIQAHHKLDARLAGRLYVCGDEYSLADIAALGSTIPLVLHGIEDMTDLPHLARWYGDLRARPAVGRALRFMLSSLQTAYVPGSYLSYAPHVMHADKASTASHSIAA